MDLKRRDFLRILSTATVATALPSCTPKRPQSLIPYVIPHEEIVPGKAVWYATVCRECPAGCGLHVRVREGRAVKVEGNPLHPVNRGALCARGQASLQGLYNPDRVQHPLRKRSDGSWEQLTWQQAEEFLLSSLKGVLKQGRGSGIAWLTPHLTGSLDGLIDEFLTAVGSRRRIRYEPIAYEAMKRANAFSFGHAQIPSYDIASAKFILSFGADFLETWLSPVGHAKDFATAREFKDSKVNRHVYVGPRLSMTAANADEWIAPKPGTEGALALGLLNIILTGGMAQGISLADSNEILGMIRGFAPSQVAEMTGIPGPRLRALAEEFAKARPGLAIGGGTIIGSETEVATLTAINLLNLVCGNIGRTVHFDRPSTLSRLNSYADLNLFVQAMEQGEISILFFTETNPVFSTPPQGNFTKAMKKVPLTVAFSSFMDETTAEAHLILPIHTSLESWGDYEPYEGVYGLMQPVMQPVFKSTRMLGDVLIQLKDSLTNRTTFSKTEQPFYEYVKARWRMLQRQIGSRQEFEVWWTEALANGGVFPERRPQPVRLRWRSSAADLRPMMAQFQNTAHRQGTESEFVFTTYPSLTHYDGRGANKPWLQELPDPMTQITWENWVEIHPDDAKNLGVERGHILQLTTAHGTIELPAYVYAGIRPGTIAVPIGQGHTEYGRYAKGYGANVYSILPPLPLESSGGLKWSNIPVRVVNRGKKIDFADVAGSDYLHGRNIVQMVTVEELLRQTKELAESDSEVRKPKHGEPGSASMYEPHDHPHYRWGMTIDLDKCTGCSACVTACYAENNVPVVGKKQVELGRELSWLRIERYFDDPPKDTSASYSPKAEFLPMLCQHCDNAPCEPVCPVYASYHTPEGLNAQVYNRCVGTRYCSNNCPYKVRRFNWFDYEWPEPLNWQLNPDVTVRTKGVMEKCTFCVQRIVEAKNSAKLEGRAVNDGEILTACQQSCPSQAIVFGDLKNPESTASKLREKNKARGYRVLEELNTQPAVVYLKEIRE
ncbi:MAG TPA: molybdopterin-dependent oxidoreductase [Bacteroidota bacterium]|nr:molybdopterin-dependent oxidoreductase [Bacteroidota bacterium]